MKKLQRPLNVFKKHLKTHHDLTVHNEVIFFEQEKDILVFGYFFFKENKSIYGQFNLQRKEIVYEIGDLTRDYGEGFCVYGSNNSKLEKLTY